MPSVELNIRKIRQRLEAEGWIIVRHGAEHDVFAKVGKKIPVIVPRHRGDLPLGTARRIAKDAGWL